MKTLLLAICLSLGIGQAQYVGNVALDNAELKQCVREKTRGMTDVDDIVSACSSLTRQCLTFSANSQLKDLRQLSLSRPTPTHCVGYAKVFTALCNYAFELNHVDAKCYHVRGPLKIIGIDVTWLLSSTFRALGMTRWEKFSQDHDYGLVKYQGRQWKVEPMSPVSIKLLGL